MHGVGRIVNTLVVAPSFELKEAHDPDPIRVMQPEFAGVREAYCYAIKRSMNVPSHRLHNITFLSRCRPAGNQPAKEAQRFLFCSLRLAIRNPDKLDSSMPAAQRSHADVT